MLKKFSSITKGIFSEILFAGIAIMVSLAVIFIIGQV